MQRITLSTIGLIALNIFNMDLVNADTVRSNSPVELGQHKQDQNREPQQEQEQNQAEQTDVDDEELIRIFNLSLPELFKVVVTAQKRQQTILEVPIAMSNIWAEQLEQLRIFNAIELAVHVPGFSSGQFNVGQPQFYIRGIGSNEDGAGGDNAVVVTVDGVPISRASASMFDFFDLQRIEVLRGPQGTLYGRNASGGVINIISRIPSVDPSKIIELGAGTQGSLEGRAYFNGGLDADDDYLGSVALSHRQRDGIVTSVYGAELSDINDTGIKAQLYFAQDIDSSWRVITELGQIRRAGPGRHAFGGAIEAAILAAEPSIASDPFTNLSPFNGFQNRDSHGITLIAEQQLDWGKFDSVSGYRHNEIQSQVDQAGVSEQQGLLSNLLGFGLQGTNDFDEKAWQFSQELRLSKQSAQWFWLAGLFYLHENTDRTEIFDYGSPSISIQQNTTDSIALFGESTLTLSSQSAITMGGRFSWEEKKVEQSATAGLLVITEDYQVRAKQSWQKFTPRLVFNYSADKSLHSYISLSTGFKSGGFQGQAPTAIAAQTPFDEENVTAYETGIKWRSTDSNHKIHLALFKMAYDDLQVLQLVDDPDNPNDVGVIITENAADATSKGLEVEWETILAEHWMLYGNYSYTDARYNHFVSEQGDFAGNYLRNAPKHSGAIAISYQTTLTNGADVDLTYSHSYQATRYQDPANNDDASIPSYQLGNLYLSYQQQQSPWRFGLWLDNVWNEVYYIHGFPLLGGGILTPAPKRVVGVKASFEF